MIEYALVLVLVRLLGRCERLHIKVGNLLDVELRFGRRKHKNK